MMRKEKRRRVLDERQQASMVTESSRDGAWSWSHSGLADQTDSAVGFQTKARRVADRGSRIAAKDIVARTNEIHVNA